MQEEKNEEIHLDSSVQPYEPERNYLPVTNFYFDWNMAMYTDEIEEAPGFKLDWNKLIYNEEQISQFSLQKEEKMMRPEFYEYLFKKPTHRSDMEKFFLQQSGFCNDDCPDEEQEDEQIIKRLVTTGLLREI
jgi:hypothetical protein